MALETGDVLKKPERPGPGQAGGKLSSRKSRALLEEVLTALDVNQGAITSERQETAVDLMEKALRTAQGKKLPPAIGYFLEEGDDVLGLGCPTCKSKFIIGDKVVAVEGPKGLYRVHWRCIYD